MLCAKRTRLNPDMASAATVFGMEYKLFAFSAAEHAALPLKQMGWRRRRRRTRTRTRRSKRRKGRTIWGHDHKNDARKHNRKNGARRHNRKNDAWRHNHKNGALKKIQRERRSLTQNQNKK